MVVVAVSVRRVFVEDGVDFPSTEIIGGNINKIVSVGLVPLFTSANGVTYDVFVVFETGGTFGAPVEFQITSNFTVVGAGASGQTLFTVTPDNDTSCDIHVRDFTGDRLITNILVVNA